MRERGSLCLGKKHKFKQRWGGGFTKEQNEVVHFFDCGDYFTGVYTNAKISQIKCFKLYSLFSLNLNKLLKNKNENRK